MLITISCGGATGVFVTYKNQAAMERVCAAKFDYYTANYASEIAALQSASTNTSAPAPWAALLGAEEHGDERLPGLWGAAALHEYVAIIEDQLK